MDKKIQKNFADLEAEAKVLVSKQRPHPSVRELSGAPIYIVPYPEFKGWGTRVLNLLQRVFGEQSVHYQEFEKIFSRTREKAEDVKACLAIFTAAKMDYEDGYLYHVRGLVKTEVLTDALDQADALMDAGYKDPACVLAGVALEVTLKELCLRHGIAVAKVDKMNADLRKHGVYNLAKQKQITAWAELRNKAAHGEWGEYTREDIDEFIQGVRRFVAEYL